MANESGSSFPFAGLAIVALFLSTAYMAQDGFDQLRQAEPEAVKRKALLPGNVDARLWEDPLAALQRHRERLREQCPPSKPEANPPADGAVPGNAPPQEARCRHTPTSPADFARGVPAADGSSVNALRDDDTVLAVLVPGAPFVGAEEARRRMRYAVLNGLAAEGFVPVESERIGLLRMPVCATLACGEPSPPLLDVPYETLEAESFKTDSVPRDRGLAAAQPGRRVVVLWLDDSALGERWLSALAALFHDLSGSSNSTMPQLRIIGPTYSGAIVQALNDLRSMADEVGRPGRAARRWQSLSRARMISPAATAADADLLQSARITGSTSLEQAFGERVTSVEAKRLKSEAPAQAQAADGRAALAAPADDRFLVRTIATDDRLIDLLDKELRQRGLCRSDGRPHGRVALLAEWDSSYARSFAHTLEQKLRCSDGSKAVQTYFYLRGLDGFTVEGAPTGQVRTGGGRTSSEQAAPVEWPEGRDQRDYLRRLVSQQLGRDATLMAIGIIGADVHDKLLLAQAVRDAFDDRVLFTTDLDARLLHPKVTAYTRNLIVATSLPLLLPQDLQDSTAPFRDVYQTALFLASRYAMQPFGSGEPDCKLCTRDKEPPFECQVKALLDDPQLYEVGRSGMTPLGGSVPSVSEEELARRRLAALLGAFLLIALGATMVLGKPGPAMQAARDRWVGCAIGSHGPHTADCSAAAFGSERHALALLAGLQAAGLAFAAGVLLELARPGTVGLGGCALLALIAAVLFWLFIFPGAARARGTPRRPSALQRPGRAALITGAALLVACAWWLLESPPSGTIHEPFALLEGVSAWPSQLLRTFALVLFFWFLDHAWCNTTRAADEIGDEHFRLSAASDAPVSRGRGVGGLVSRIQDVSVWFWHPRTPVPDRDGAIDGAALWAEYQQRLRNGPRLLRLAFWLAVLITLLAAVSLSLDGVRPIIPARGEADRGLFFGTMLAAALALALLLTLVADSTVLTWRLLGLLRRGRTVHPAQTVARFASELGDELAAQATVPVAASPTPGRAEGGALRSTVLDDWIELRLIARHSAAMGPQILLPFVLLALLLVARSRLFDNWHLGDIVLVMFSVMITWAVVIAALLKHGAERSRTHALERMQADLVWLKGAGPAWAALAERYPALIDQARGLKGGAFAPLFEQPIVRAALVPLGGAGGVQLLDLLLFAR
jgi:hypothetical protein